MCLYNFQTNNVDLQAMEFPLVSLFLDNRQVTSNVSTQKIKTGG